MPSTPAQGQIGRQLESIAAELDQVNTQVRKLEVKVAATLGGSATKADKALLAGLSVVSSSAQQAQQAVSAAATTLHR